MISNSIQYKFQFRPGDSQQVFPTGFQTWGDLIKKVSPVCLKYHKQSTHQQQFSRKIHVIEVKGTMKDRDSLQQSIMIWRILKDTQDFIDLNQKINFQNKLELSDIQNQVNSHKMKPITQEKLMDTGKQIITLVNYLNALASKKETKGNQKFLQFINHCVNKSKWNLHIYGHFYIQKAQQVGFMSRCLPCFSQDEKQSKSLYLTVTSQGIMYSQQALLTGKLQQMMTFGPKMKIGFTLEFQFSKYVLGIQLNYRKLLLHFPNFQKLMKFTSIFHLALAKSGYKQKIRFNSFAPIRKDNNCQILIHGENYFANLCDDLRKAKKSVCITGWIISAQFLLKRPDSIADSPDRFDRVIGQIADKGIHVFILLYKQPTAFADNDSQYVQDHLEKLSKNITILRHPSPIIPKLWSHHQKMVLIDQQIAYVGGLDITYSRWDNSTHSISDISNLWDGIDYNNNRITGLKNVEKYKEDVIDRIKQPRMPWHDVGAKITGSAVIDFKRHFVQYWNFAMHQLKQSSEVFQDKFQERRKKLNSRIKLRSQSNIKLGINSKVQKKNSFDQNFDEIKFDEKFIKNNQIVVDSQQQEVQELQYYNAWLSQNKKNFQKMKKKKDQMKKKVGERIVTLRPTQIYVQGTFNYGNLGDFQIQVLRSASSWTIGMTHNRQHSIHQAYFRLIKSSKYFIYIENQFFMGQEHRIFEALVERIIEAHKEQKEFKVIIILPLCPDQPTNILDIEQSPILGKLLYEQYKSIKMILQQLKNAGISNSQDYIFFFGLRNHGVLGKQKYIPQTEQIYVHSKVMVVDDNKMIIGSANINDRSMLGNRDSQLAIYLESKSEKNDQIWNFRKEVWKQHFGLNDEEAQNIYKCWQKMLKNARKNTKIYRDLFGCYPDNEMKNLKDVKQFKKRMNSDRYDELKGQIVGFAVQFPYQFLREQKLDFKPYQKQNIVPNIMWI